jgi:hypothetical protein
MGASVQDLRDVYGDEAVLAEGQIAYKGRGEIDKWAIACINGRIKLCLWEGAVYNEVKDVDRFLRRICVDDDNKVLYMWWRDRIIENWGGVEDTGK